MLTLRVPMFLKDELDILPFLELKYHNGFIVAEGFVRLSSSRTSSPQIGQPVNLVIDTGAVFGILAPEDWETWDEHDMKAARPTAPEDVALAVSGLGFEDTQRRNFAWKHFNSPSVSGITGIEESVKLVYCDFYFRLTKTHGLVTLPKRLVKCLPRRNDITVKRRSLIGLSTLMDGSLYVDMRNSLGKIADQPKLFIREDV